jgi:hypothetical protein
MAYTNIAANEVVGADKSPSAPHEMYDTSLTSVTNLESTLIKRATALPPATDLGLVALLV